MQEADPYADFNRQAEQLIPAQVRIISVCHSEQTSADLTNVNSSARNKLPKPAGRSGGACTSALLGLLHEKQNQNLTLQQVLSALRKSLASSGFDQIPQLGTSRSLDLQGTPYSLAGGNGVRRALLVGINYVGQRGELNGCSNDVLNMKKYIIEEQGYVEDNICVLIDDEIHQDPTRDNIMHSLKQLVEKSVSGDSVYFHYSGHGGLLTPEWNDFKMNNDASEYDETIYPVDYDRSGQIRDFSLFNHFVKLMPAGVTVTCMMDCCHSGSVLDLPYTYQPTSTGSIRAQHSMDSLTNLAFLYILAGGTLAGGFDDVIKNIEDVAGGTIGDYYGTGVEQMADDISAAEPVVDYNAQTDHTEDYDSTCDGESACTSDAEDPEHGNTFDMHFTAEGANRDFVNESDDYDENWTDCGCILDSFSGVFEEDNVDDQVQGSYY